MSEFTVKSAVRKRDGNRCQQCDITEEEHLAKYNIHLNVHRLIPGSAYRENLCVTLCHACHGTMPRNLKQVVFWPSERTGVRLYFFNLYDEDHVNLVEALDKRAEELKIETGELIMKILQDHVAKLSSDYCI